MFIFAFLLSFILSILFTYLIRKLALYYKIVDYPRPGRKIHKKAIPLLGGLSLFLSFSIVLGYFTFFTDRILGGYMLLKHILGLIIGGVIIIVGGFLDDKYNLKPYQQFVFPLLAALVIIGSGVGINYIRNPFGQAFQLDTIKFEILRINNTPYHITLLADLFTLIWLLGMMYTTKFLDGLDGLVSGIGVIASLILFFVSLSSEVRQPETALVCIILAGAAGGFLIFNFHPAKIFLGEGGSVFIGFILGSLAIISGGKIATTLLCMGIPILDVLWVILRRLFTGQSPFLADKKHLHFRLLDIGFSHRKAVLFLWVLSAGFGLTGLLLQTQGKFFGLLFLTGVMICLALFLVFGSRILRSRIR